MARLRLQRLVATSSASKLRVYRAQVLRNGPRLRLLEVHAETLPPQPKLRVHRVSVVTGGSAHLRVHRVRLGTASGVLRVYRVRLAGTPLVRLRLHRVGLDYIGDVPVTDTSVESMATVTISAPLTGAATNCVFVQTAGAAVALTGSGASRSFTAPVTVDGDLVTVVYTAALVAGGTETGAITVAVRPHQWWVRRAGTWQPFRRLSVP